MAENLKDNRGKGDNNGPLSDEDKKELVRQLDQDLTPHEKSKKEANDAMKALRRDFKKKTGIVQNEFNSMRALAHIEDGDEQDQKTANMKIVFDALSQNKQLNFFDGDDEEPKPKKK